MKNRLILIVLLSIFVFYGCSPGLHRESQFLMGTYVEVVSEDLSAADIVFGEFKRLDSVFNIFDTGSELSRLNKAGEIHASEDLFEIIKKAKQFYELTGGAFDVTVAPVSVIWKKAIRSSKLPAKEAIDEALSHVGFDNVYLDDNSRQIKFLKLGMMVDLGAIAKGYAIDKAVLKLKEAGVSSAVVNAGGDIFCLGENRRKAWAVGIQDPRIAKSIAEKIELKNMAVATSGDYEQFFVFQNKRYSHIINPKSGYPADSGIVSATVVTKDALTADVLATAVVVAGKAKAAEFLKEFAGARVKIIDEKGNIDEL